MRPLASIAVSALFVQVLTCPEGHDAHYHTHSRRNSEPQAVSVAAPTQPLVWGDLNIIHTTDSHGWLLGHQKATPPEPNYSGDFGDFASFVQHMKEEADRRGVDLLLVDSGDLHDGTGLSDAFPPGGVDAHDSNRIFAELPYDLLAIGNHELNIYANTLDVHQNFVPRWNGRYLSSNANITVSDKHGNPVSIPVGSLFTKFTTKMGRRITSLGVLFHFTGNDKNTTVQAPADMVKEAWFQQAIAEEPDLFVLVGHMPVQRGDWPFVFNAIRAVHPFTPIIILGGHTHIRDCVQLDNRSMSLESGRYMETVGWLSANLPRDNQDHQPIQFTRRYLDANRVSYQFHTGRSTSPLKQFNTPHGLKVSADLQALAQRFDILHEYGTAPQDYFLTRVAVNDSRSLLSLFINDVIPYAVTQNNTRSSIPHAVFANAGSQRFDLFSGPFTTNDQFTISPFINGFQYISSVPFGVVKQIFPLLSVSGLPARKRNWHAEELDQRGDVTERYNAWIRAQWEQAGMERRDATNLTLGYVTRDACPGIGDDVPHTPLSSFPIPPFLASPLPPIADDNTPIDIIFSDFIANDILIILSQINTNSGGTWKNYTMDDVAYYTDVKTNQVYEIYAAGNWN